jgi:glutamyl/glutaminyl-tRNA synthetase
MTQYRGRIAPTPTGYLHVGHAMTFWRAQARARAAGGSLILRIEDLDVGRCQSEFRAAMIEDLRWFGLQWDEGPDKGGSFAPYVQSERGEFYYDAWEKLRAGGHIYPCRCSRKDVLGAAMAPHDENEEPIYPGTCRPVAATVSAADVATALSRRAAEKETPRQSGATTGEGLPPGTAAATTMAAATTSGTHWRFRVPDGEKVSYVDLRLGEEHAIAGEDFGDFVVWRKDYVPAYQLAVVVDDAAMQITEVVRGEDLLTSTFRQLLIYRALNLPAPQFYHGPLITDESGRRLAKRDASQSLRALREAGADPEEIRRRNSPVNDGNFHE